MRILVDGDIYSRTVFGGMVRYCNQLIDGLIARGVDVDLLVHDGLRLPNGGGLPACRLVRSIPQSRRYDIFHGSYYSDIMAVPNARTVVTVHDMIDELLAENLIRHASSSQCTAAKASAVGLADHVIAISRTTRQDLQRVLGVEDRRISVVYHGVGPEFAICGQVEGRRLAEGELDLTQPFILHVGGREGYKNFGFLMEAYAMSGAKGRAKLVAVGSQTFLLPHERALAEAHGLQSDIILTGYVSDRLLSGLYACASVLMMPTLYEGFGYPLVEAMACGAVVACSTAPALVELGQGVPLVFDPHDVAGAARVIDRALSEDHSQRKEQARRIASGFSIQSMIDGHLDAYQTVLAQATPPSLRRLTVAYDKPDVAR
jgi:glycosyltransferase involved in cell wall biosynthesis